MQHYELPTRLLDISMNPLVGLYFSVCSDEKKDGEIIIFFVHNDEVYNYDDNWVTMLSRLSFMSKNMIDVKNDTEKWHTFISSLRNLQEPLPYIRNYSDLDKVLCVLPKLDNPRIIRQHGAFFLFGICEGNKSKMSSLSFPNIKMSIPANKKRTILMQLDQLGINEKFCFPELDKVAHYLKANL